MAFLDSLQGYLTEDKAFYYVVSYDVLIGLGDLLVKWK